MLYFKKKPSKRLSAILLFVLLATGTGCHRSANESDQIVSMQLIDRNGFTETISNKDRLTPYQQIDFLSPQPYQKVLRVYGRTPDGKSLSKISSYHPNGHIWQLLEVVDGRAHGSYEEWYSNGQMKIKAQVIEGLADITELAQRGWVFHDASYVWDENGAQIAVIHYEKGLLHTPSIYYHSNGQIAQILPYEGGLLHGDVISYNAEGVPLEKISYSKGKKQGTCLGYWSLNQPLYEEEYEEDRLISGSYYDSSGNLVSSVCEGNGIQSQFTDRYLSKRIEFAKGIPEGRIEELRPNGTLIRTYMIHNEKKHGEEWEYYPYTLEEKPLPKLCIHWNDDQIQGQVKTWYDNGVLESQRELLQYKKQGLAFAWYKNGDIMLMEEYNNDLLTKASYFKKGDKKPVSKIEDGKGTATLYTSEGLLLKKIPYEKGSPILESN